LTWVDQSRRRDTRQRRPANAPAKRITALATPPKIHGDDEEDLASAASTTAGRLGTAETALAVALALGETDSVVAVAVAPDGDADAVGCDDVVTGIPC